MSAIEGLRRKCIGKMGSFGVLYVTHASNTPKSIKSMIPVVRVPIMTPLPHP
jgi:hypothetical protein